MELKPALTEYPKQFGCPNGGEVCVQVDIDSIPKDRAFEAVREMQDALKQSTVTINYGDGDTIYSADGGKNVKEAGAYQFDIPLKGKDPVAVGNKVQEAIKGYMDKHPGEFIASGAVVTKDDGLHYMGSQFIGDLEAGQEPDRKGFKKALEETIDMTGLRRDKGLEHGHSVSAPKRTLLGDIQKAQKELNKEAKSSHSETRAASKDDKEKDNKEF
ncbi:MAG: hypothetical protein ACI4CS_04710 [Candidatus Weimeria sp.]